MHPSPPPSPGSIACLMVSRFRSSFVYSWCEPVLLLSLHLLEKQPWILVLPATLPNESATYITTSSFERYQGQGVCGYRPGAAAVVVGGEKEWRTENGTHEAGRTEGDIELGNTVYTYV